MIENLLGGKLEPNETVEAAAIRELREESSLEVRLEDLKSKGYLVFKMIETNKLMRVHVFEATVFSGTETESEEMRPKWFEETAIPYKQMWADDNYWLPLLLQGKSFIGRFDYEDDDTISDYTLKEQ